MVRSGPFRTFLLLILLMGTTGCGGTGPDEQHIPPVEHAEYYESLLFEAGSLVMDMRRGQSSWTRSIELDDDLLQDFHYALIRIHLDPDVPSAIGWISDWFRCQVSGISLTVAETGGWEPGGHAPIPAVDSLMTRYALAISGISSSGPPWKVYLQAFDRPLDMFALGWELRRIPGIEDAGPPGLGGDGSRIEAEISYAGIGFRFSRAWGDCLSGCTFRHYWDVLVRWDGRVLFLGERGDPWPGASGMEAVR